MNLKENVSYIKEELSTEEKFFESFFKVEKFYKKYKVAILSVIGLIIAFISISEITDYIKEQNKIKANKAYNNILLNRNDKKSIEILKEANNKLLNIALLQISKEKTQTTNVEFLKQITMYNKAIQDKDISALNRLILEQNFLLKDFAIFNKALIQTQNKQYKKAKQTLETIPFDSSIIDLVIMLKHYLVTK